MAAPIQTAMMATFPFGISSFGMPVIGDDTPTTGRIFFVDSTAGTKGDDANHGAAPMSPFATLDFAFSMCQQNRGDRVYVLSGHIETIITANGINMDVAGVQVFGLGSGRDRPKFTFSTTVNASLTVNAANCVFKNCVLDFTGIDAIAGGIDVNEADFTLVGNEILFSSAAGQASNVVVGDANAHRMRILGNFFNGDATVGPATAIVVNGAADGIEIAYNRIQGSFSSAVVQLFSTTNIFLHHNRLQNFSLGDLVIDVDATGSVEYNTLIGTDLTNLLNSTGSIAALIENYGYDSDTLGVTGTLVPAIGTTLVLGSSLVDQIIGNEVSALRANFVPVTADFTQAAWNTVGKHKLFSVLGHVRVRIIAFCTGDLTSGGAATIALGHTTNTAAFIAATLATDIDNNEYWLSATPAKTYPFSTVINQITGEVSIGFEIAVAALTGGTLAFYCWWEPIQSAGSEVTASTGVAF